MRAREKADAFFRFVKGTRSASEHPPEFPWGCEQAAILEPQSKPVV
jgi:hypothetical protein